MAIYDGKAATTDRQWLTVYSLHEATDEVAAIMIITATSTEQVSVQCAL